MIDKGAFRVINYGLYIVTAVDATGKKVGCIANTFQQVASTPPTASVSLNKENATTQAILDTGKYGITVLSQDATMELIGVFGFHSSNDRDKYADISHELCDAGIPHVREAANAHFTVKVDQTVDVGTHIMFIGEVIEAKLLEGNDPMTYSYYHNVLRGKTPPKAASYESDGGAAQPASTSDANGASAEPTGKKRYAWRCTLCGYIENMEELPDDYKCPICGVGKEFFERIEVED